MWYLVKCVDDKDMGYITKGDVYLTQDGCMVYKITKAGLPGSLIGRYSEFRFEKAEDKINYSVF